MMPGKPSRLFDHDCMDVEALVVDDDAAELAQVGSVGAVDLGPK